MAVFRTNEATLKRISERQWVDHWGQNYTAAIFANPKEAPGISTGTILTPQLLGRRDFHTLSRNETWAALLALHHPSIWELWEQRILYPCPRTHFLFGHNRAVGQTFSRFEGTIDVADRLGILNKHPRVSVKKGEDPQSRQMAPFFYIGDLLLFLKDEHGAYLLNWPVKDKYKDFRRKGPHRFGKLHPDVDDKGAIERNLLEETYFSDAGIRTQQIAGEAIDFELRCNLYDLFLDHAIDIKIEQDVRDQIMDVFREAIGTQILAYKVVREVATKFRVPERESLSLLRQGIWQRELRVDLFRPVLIDRPLRAEVRDVFDVYGYWFKR